MMCCPLRFCSEDVLADSLGGGCFSVFFPWCHPSNLQKGRCLCHLRCVSLTEYLLTLLGVIAGTKCRAYVSCESKEKKSRFKNLAPLWSRGMSQIALILFFFFQFSLIDLKSVASFCVSSGASSLSSWQLCLSVG